MLPIIAVAIAIISGIICYSITKNRNTNEYIWGGCGVLIGPLLIPFCFIPKKTNKKEIEVERKTESETND